MSAKIEALHTQQLQLAKSSVEHERLALKKEQLALKKWFEKEGNVELGKATMQLAQSILQKRNRFQEIEKALKENAEQSCNKKLIDYYLKSSDFLFLNDLLSIDQETGGTPTACAFQEPIVGEDSELQTGDRNILQKMHQERETQHRKKRDRQRMHQLLDDAYSLQIDKQYEPKSMSSLLLNGNSLHESSEHALEGIGGEGNRCDGLLTEVKRIVYSEEDTEDAMFFDICAHCKVEKYLHRSDAQLVCPSCYRIESVLLDPNKPTHKDPPRDHLSYSYKRMNHLNEWLSQVQAKQNTEIPEEVLLRVLVELRKEGIEKDFEKLRSDRVKKILRRLKLSKHYGQVHMIIYNLSGKAPPVMSRTDEDQIRNLFRQMQLPWLLYKPTGRKNFMGYSYVLYKLCELLNLDELKDYFSLQKNREKTHSHDLCWKKICDHLGWQFIKTI